MQVPGAEGKMTSPRFLLKHHFIYQRKRQINPKVELSHVDCKCPNPWCGKTTHIVLIDQPLTEGEPYALLPGAVLCHNKRWLGAGCKNNPHSLQVLSLFTYKEFSGKSTGRTGSSSPGRQQPTAGHHLSPRATQREASCVRVHIWETLDNYYR